MPHSLVGLPSTLIWLGTAGEVSTRRTPRWVKVPTTSVSAPLTTGTVWQGGSVQPCTWVKHTVWEPADSFIKFKPQESLILPSTVTWLGNAGLVVTRSMPWAATIGIVKAPVPVLFPTKQPAGTPAGLARVGGVVQ